MVAFLEAHPFPFNKPAGQELWRTLAGLVPVPLDAIAVTEAVDLDPLQSGAGGKLAQVDQCSW